MNRLPGSAGAGAGGGAGDAHWPAGAGAGGAGRGAGCLLAAAGSLPVWPARLVASAARVAASAATMSMTAFASQRSASFLPIAAAASDMPATWSMLVSTGSNEVLIQSAVSSASSTSSPPPRCTIGSAFSRCSPLPCGSGTYAAGRPTAVSSAQVMAPARHSAKSAAA